jgi:hypothetical protein
MGNTKKFQTYVPYTTRLCDNESIASSLREIVDSAKEYANDYVEVHQILKVHAKEEEVQYLIILNHIRNVDDLGEKIDYY